MGGKTKKDRLLARLKENYSSLQAELLQKDRQSLIDSAEYIMESARVYEYLRYKSDYQPSELDYLLKFQDPLDVVTNNWIDSCRPYKDDLSRLLRDCSKSGRDFKRHTLVSPDPPENPLKKFMNVDVIGSLQAIMGQITGNNQEDFEQDKQLIARASWEVSPNNKNLIWLCWKNGTYMFPEREVFIRGTEAYNNLQFYSDGLNREPVALYTVEVTGTHREKIRGNIYERDLRQYAAFAQRLSSPYTNIGLTFANDMRLRIPCEDLNFERAELEHKYGKIVATRPEAEDESVVQGGLQREHDQREGLKKGDIHAHVAELKKPSIKEQLAAPPVPGEKPAQKTKGIGPR